MEQKPSTERAVREIRRKARRRFSRGEKIGIVIQGGHCFALPPRAHRRKPLLQMEQGVPRSRQEAPASDTQREASSGEVREASTTYGAACRGTRGGTRHPKRKPAAPKMVEAHSEKKDLTSDSGFHCSPYRDL